MAFRISAWRAANAGDRQPSNEAIDSNADTENRTGLRRTRNESPTQASEEAPQAPSRSPKSTKPRTTRTGSLITLTPMWRANSAGPLTTAAIERSPRRRSSSCSSIGVEPLRGSKRVGQREILHRETPSAAHRLHATPGSTRQRRLSHGRGGSVERHRGEDLFFGRSTDVSNVELR